jgi:hypothetical protein
MDIIHRPIYYLKHNISETGFCLGLHVESTQLGPIYRASLSGQRLALSVGPD